EVPNRGVNAVATTVQDIRRGWGRWWPALSGIAVAVLAGLDVADGGEALAPVLAASALIYLGAAALGRPGASWPLFLASFVVLAVAGDSATWALVGAGALLAAYGLVRGAARGLPLQAVGMAGFGAVALVTLEV